MPLAVLLLVSALAGAANALSLAWPWQVPWAFGQTSWVLQCVAMLIYAHLQFAVRTPLWATLIGFVFHGTTLFISLSWLHISMAQYGGLPTTVAWGAVLLLAAFLAMYGAITIGVWKSLAGRSSALAVPLFAAAWLFAELARGQWLTGFGWAAVAYAHLDGPFAWTAPWIGAYGMGGVIALWAAATISYARQSQRVRQILLLVAVLSGWLIGPQANFTEKTSALNVELLQGNIAQDEKFEANTGVASALQWYGERLRATQAEVVLAPETAIPVLPQQLPADYWRAWPSAETVAGATRLIGIPLGDMRDGYTNSVIGFQTPFELTKYRYDKYHLVPFGEFIPPLFKWFVRLMQIPLGDFERGALAQAPLRVRAERIAPAICFEDLFSEELAARFQDPSQSPTILANFSNLAWFGASTAMYQHLSISRMRSMEFARPSLRVSNTGVTAIVEYDGTVGAKLAPLTQGVLPGQVWGRTGLTPYAWWASRWGLWPLWGISLSVLGMGYWRYRRGVPQRD